MSVQRACSAAQLHHRRRRVPAGEADALDDEDVANLLEAPDSGDELTGGDSASASDLDTDEEALRYEASVDQYMDAAYQAYLERHHARDANRVERHKRKRLAGDGARPSHPPFPPSTHTLLRTAVRGSISHAETCHAISPAT